MLNVSKSVWPCTLSGRCLICIIWVWHLSWNCKDKWKFKHLKSWTKSPNVGAKLLSKQRWLGRRCCYGARHIKNRLMAPGFSWGFEWAFILKGIYLIHGRHVYWYRLGKSGSEITIKALMKSSGRGELWKWKGFSQPHMIESFNAPCAGFSREK